MFFAETKQEAANKENMVETILRQPLQVQEASWNDSQDFASYMLLNYTNFGSLVTIIFLTINSSKTKLQYNLLI